ncbi:MAG: RNA methyltransferase [Bryobacteraceae bacterium]
MPAEAMKAESITSSKNPLLKEIRRAIARGELTESGCMVAETFHLLEEAIRSNRPIQAVVVAASVRSAVDNHVRGLRGVRTTVVPDAVFREVAATETSQGVITLVQAPEWRLDQLFRGRSMLVVLDGVQDPGNAGAIIRAAEAFGATGAMFLKGTVNPANPKALRASAGSLFRLPHMAGLDHDLVRAALEQNRLDVYAADPRGKHALGECDLKRSFALLIGSEAHGVSAKLSSEALTLRIPTVGVESLNAAMAAGVVLYEASRQRTVRR